MPAKINQAAQRAQRVADSLGDLSDKILAEESDKVKQAQASACWHLSRCHLLGVGVEEKSMEKADRLVVKLLLMVP